MSVNALGLSTHPYQQVRSITWLLDPEGPGKKAISPNTHTHSLSTFISKSYSEAPKQSEALLDPLGGHKRPLTPLVTSPWWKKCSGPQTGKYFGKKNHPPFSVSRVTILRDGAAALQVMHSFNSKGILAVHLKKMKKTQQFGPCETDLKLELEIQIIDQIHF
jgi:hypothetical protein